MLYVLSLACIPQKYTSHFTVCTSHYRFGPLVHHWTMRYEAKHRYFKQLTSTIGNFINLPYTLAMRHQSLQCYIRLGSDYNHKLHIGKGDIASSLPCFCLKYCGALVGVDMSRSTLPHLASLQGSDIYW